MNKDILFKMLSYPSVSGYEINFQKMLINELKEVDDSVITHISGNVIHVINPESNIKVMLLAHIDEIGLVIEGINEDGTCKVTNIGAVRPEMYIGQHVHVIRFNKKGYDFVPGVIGYTSKYEEGHIKVEDLILDLGFNSKEEASKKVAMGQPVIHATSYEEMANDLLAARALDDKIAAFIGIETLKKVKARSNNGVYLVTTVNEETTSVGAEFSVVDVNPTCAIALDVGSSSDISYRSNFTRETSLGKGGMLTYNCAGNKVLFDMLENIAKEKQIPIQYVVEPSRTYTDFDQVSKKNKGIPSTLISIPLRYMHSAVEVCSLKDVEYISDLLTEFICGLTENDSFDPFKE